jgi:hypothetical protein
VLTALDSLGKSCLAESTTLEAWLWIVLNCDFRLLSPPLVTALGSSLTEFCRFVRSPQYAGLLLVPHPARAPMVIAARNTSVPAARQQSRGLPDIAVLP